MSSSQYDNYYFKRKKDKSNFYKLKQSNFNLNTLGTSILICNYNENEQSNISTQNHSKYNVLSEYGELNNNHSIRLVPPPRKDSLPQYNHKIVENMIEDIFNRNKESLSQQKFSMFIDSNFHDNGVLFTDDDALKSFFDSK